MKLSVVINTKNSAKTLELTLKSVQDWAYEIVVVDMESIDDTVKLAKKYGAKVFKHKDVNYVEPARNFAIGKARGDWILILDSDEEVTSELKRVIDEVVSQDSKEKDDDAQYGLTGLIRVADAYYVARKNIIFNKWIQHTGWWPDYQLRLFKKGAVEWTDEIHGVPITKGEVKQLPTKEELAILHHNYSSVTEFIERLNRYTTIQAKSLENFKLQTPNFKQSSNIKHQISNIKILSSFFDEFLTRYFAQLGYKDGAHGLSLSLLQAMSEAVAQMKVLEVKGFQSFQLSTTNDQLRLMRSFQRDLNYWIADYQVQHSKFFKKLYWLFRRKFKL